jgi:hypothetical protein
MAFVYKDCKICLALEGIYKLWPQNSFNLGRLLLKPFYLTWWKKP